MIEEQQVPCAECGDLIDVKTAESCDHCQIWLCDNCWRGHDCDGWLIAYNLIRLARARRRLARKMADA